MGVLRIDEAKCQHDGICVATCPARLIEQKEAGKIPTHIAGALPLCINCYHCVAACPHGALAIGEVSATSCPPLDKETELSLEQAEKFLRSRRSIRAYKDNLVDKEKIKALIEVASHAPSGHNNRDLRWLIVHNPADVQRLSGMAVDWAKDMIKNQPGMAEMFHFDRLVKGWEAGLDPVCRKAPHLIIVYSSKYNLLAQSSATIALTYLEIAATSAGMGTCWAGYFHIAASAWEPLQKVLSLKKGEATYGAMMLGYPKYKYHRLPPRPEPNINYF